MGSLCLCAICKGLVWVGPLPFPKPWPLSLGALFHLQVKEDWTLGNTCTDIFCEYLKMYTILV